MFKYHLYILGAGIYLILVESHKGRITVLYERFKPTVTLEVLSVIDQLF